jgi:hypothetical protein
MVLRPSNEQILLSTYYRVQRNPKAKMTISRRRIQEVEETHVYKGTISYIMGEQCPKRA